RLIQREYAPATQLRRELTYSGGTAVVFSLVGTAIWYGTRAQVFRVYTSVAEHGWAWFVFTVALLVVGQDTYFYWTHRAMHHRLLFRHVHRAHHRSHNPSPLAAYAFSPAEALVHAAYVPLMLLVVPAHVVAVFLFLSFMILRNVLGHLGIELFPAGFVRSRFGRWSTTATHHGLHHRRVDSNYGLYFTFWDRLMGTTDPGYEAAFDEVVSRTKRPARVQPGDLQA
ncbi:MAG TPA: sterol desaturase family protein, partial [Polyangiaceae bacterium]|nr:sterol desaturase family protein [Polyangiaceae bacterium]